MNIRKFLTIRQSDSVAKRKNWLKFHPTMTAMNEDELPSMDFWIQFNSNLFRTDNSTPLPMTQASVPLYFPNLRQRWRVKDWSTGSVLRGILYSPFLMVVALCSPLLWSNYRARNSLLRFTKSIASQLDFSGINMVIVATFGAAVTIFCGILNWITKGGPAAFDRSSQWDMVQDIYNNLKEIDANLLKSPPLSKEDTTGVTYIRRSEACSLRYISEHNSVHFKLDLAALATYRKENRGISHFSGEMPVNVALTAAYLAQCSGGRSRSGLKLIAVSVHSPHQISTFVAKDSRVRIEGAKATIFSSLMMNILLAIFSLLQFYQVQIVAALPKSDIPLIVILGIAKTTLPSIIIVRLGRCLFWINATTDSIKMHEIEAVTAHAGFLATIALGLNTVLYHTTTIGGIVAIIGVAATTFALGGSDNFGLIAVTISITLSFISSSIMELGLRQGPTQGDDKFSTISGILQSFQNEDMENILTGTCSWSSSILQRQLARKTMWYGVKGEKVGFFNKPVDYVNLDKCYGANDISQNT